MIRKLLYLAFVLWGISLGTFALFSLAPGDPAEIILRDRNEAPGQAQIQALRLELGLDAPWGIRYLCWLKKILGGDLGVSWQTGQPVMAEITDRMPATLELATAAFLLVVLISSLAGGAAAFFRNRLPDHLIQIITVIVTAMPPFWLGILLIYGLSLNLCLFPVAGRGTLRHLVLPAVTLALGVAFLQANVLRATLIRIMSQDYVCFARAKGLGRRMIFIRHMLPAALAPMVNLWGMSLGQLLGGAVIVESVFAWPGIGRLTVEAVMGRDIPTAQAIVLLISFTFVLVNTISDLVHQSLDPQLGNNP